MHHAKIQLEQKKHKVNSETSHIDDFIEKLHKNKGISNSEFNSEHNFRELEDSCVAKCRKHGELEAEIQRLIKINEAIKE